MEGQGTGPLAAGNEGLGRAEGKVGEEKGTGKENGEIAPWLLEERRPCSLKCFSCHILTATSSGPIISCNNCIAV